MQDPVYHKLMEYAMRSLARRAHTVHELRKKLRKRPLYSLDLESQIIARLKELKLLDDEAYVQRAVEQASTFTYQGRFKVAQKLKLKGIPYELTNRVWNDMEIEEARVAQLALKKIEKRLQALPKEKRQAKRAQFLAGRGFTPEIVFELSKES